MTEFIQVKSISHLMERNFEGPFFVEDSERPYLGHYWGKEVLVYRKASPFPSQTVIHWVTVDLAPVRQ